MVFLMNTFVALNILYMNDKIINFLNDCGVKPVNKFHVNLPFGIDPITVDDVCLPKLSVKILQLVKKLQILQKHYFPTLLQHTTCQVILWKNGKSVSKILSTLILVIVIVMIEMLVIYLLMK